MSVTYTCPECGAKLRPARPLPAGKKVKCPKCTAIFLPDDDSPKTVAVVPDAKAVRGAKPAPAPPAKKADDDWGDKNPYDVLVDDGPPAEKLTFDKIRDQFPRSMRGPAQKAVVVPANLALAVAILQIVLCIITFLVGVWPFIFNMDPGKSSDKNSAAAIANLERKELTSGERVFQFSLIGGSIFWFLWNAVLVNAAHKMHTLESYPWAMTGAIMGLIAGLTVFTSIWCLIVLSNEDVKAGFAERNPYKQI